MVWIFTSGLKPKTGHTLEAGFAWWRLPKTGLCGSQYPQRDGFLDGLVAAFDIQLLVDFDGVPFDRSR